MTTPIRKEYIRQEHINCIEKFLIKAHRAAKDGYVKTSMSSVASHEKVQSVSLALQATRSLGVMKQRGERRAAMWYWTADGSPNSAMAERVYNEIRRMKTNIDLEKRTSGDFKKKNLVPIKGTKRELKNDASKLEIHINNVLGELYASDEPINLAASAKRHNVDQNAVFGTLISLNVLQPHNTLPGQYVWKHGAPDDDMLELIMTSYPGKVGPMSKKTEGKRNRMLDILKTVAAESPYTKSMSALIKAAQLQSTFLSFAIKEKMVINDGTWHKPMYRLTVEPSMDVVLKLEELVNADNKRIRTGEKTTPIVTVEAKQEETVVNEESSTDLNSIYGRAIKRKKYLEEELAKVNKIIGEVNNVRAFAETLSE